MDMNNRFDYLYELFTLVTNHSGTGVCIIDANSKELYLCNQIGYLITKCNSKNYQGMNCHKAIFNRDSPCGSCPLEKNKLGKDEYIISAEKEGVTFQVKSEFVHWEGKDLLIEFFTDISDGTKLSERIQREKSVTENSFDLAKTKMINNDDLISYVIYDLTNDHFINTSSGKYCDLTQYRDCSALSVFAQDMSQIIIDAEKRYEYLEIHNRNNLLEKYSEGEKDIKLDIEMKLANNQERWERIELLMAENPVDGSIYLFEYAYDINKEKNIEIMMDYAVNDEYDLIGNVNLHTGDCVLMYGENSFNAFGKNVVEENYDISLERFTEEGVQDDYQEKYRQLASLENVKKNLEKQDSYEIIIYTKYGGEKRVKRDRYALYESASNYCLFTQTDITDILKVEEQQRNELQEALNNANKAIEAKGTFLSRMSHEMRTPLNSILGGTELAKEGLRENKDISGDIELIQQSGIFLLSLINDILDVSRIQADKIVFNKEWCSPGHILNTAIEMMKPVMQEKRLHFIYPDLSKANNKVQWYVDSRRIIQLLINLLNNSAKFTQEGGTVTLEIENLEFEKTRSKDIVIVTDTGCGMSEEFVSHIGEMFNQEQNTLSSSNGGSGLGLYIVKKIVEQMDGEFNVISEVDKGTSISFTVAYEYRVLDKEVVQPKVVDDYDLSGVRILIAEDQQMNQIVVKRLLERMNAVVDIANNGKEAVDMFKKSNINYYDVILMDVRMPVMDGVTATKAIKSLSRDDSRTISIIALSADAIAEEVDKIKKEGFAEYLTKPVEPKKLYSTIKSFVKR